MWKGHETKNAGPKTEELGNPKTHKPKRWILAALAAFLLVSLITRHYWFEMIAEGLVCDEDLVAGDVVVIDNLDADYLLFERAAALLRQGLAQRAVVTASAGRDGETPGRVPLGIVGVMARVAWLKPLEVVPIREIEPVSLNAARQVRDFLAKEKVSSVILVTPGFRSRRSALVYRAVLGEAGIQVHCSPVFGLKKPDNWTQTWHGVQEVVLQWIKLAYYRGAVL